MRSDKSRQVFNVAQVGFDVQMGQGPLRIRLGPLGGHPQRPILQPMRRLFGQNEQRVNPLAIQIKGKLQRESRLERTGRSAEKVAGVLNKAAAQIGGPAPGIRERQPLLSLLTYVKQVVHKRENGRRCCSRIMLGGDDATSGPAQTPSASCCSTFHCRLLETPVP